MLGTGSDDRLRGEGIPREGEAQPTAAWRYDLAGTRRYAPWAGLSSGTRPGPSRLRELPSSYAAR